MLQGNGYDEYEIIRNKLTGQFYLVIKIFNLFLIELVSRIVAEENKILC